MGTATSVAINADAAANVAIFTPTATTAPFI
jgi:hypothetical protein